MTPLVLVPGIENTALTSPSKMLRACAPGGCLVLSGLLEIQADGVEQAYQACGLPAARRLIDGEWCALIWEDVPRQGAAGN